MSGPAGLALPAGQVPQSQLPGGVRRHQAGERLKHNQVRSGLSTTSSAYLGVFGQAGQAVSVAVQRTQERLGEDSLQLDGVQGSLIFSLGLERMQLWTAMFGSKYKYKCFFPTNLSYL